MRPGTNVGPTRTRGGNWPGGGVRHAQLEARPVHPAPDLVHRPVRRADHEVRARRHGAHVLDAADAAGKRDEVDLGIQRAERLGGHVDLAPADVGHPVQHLPVQVAQLDRVVVHRDDAPHARARQPGHRPRPEPARAEHHHGRVAQRELHVAWRSSRATPDRRSSAAAGRSGAASAGERPAAAGSSRRLARPRRPPPAPRWPRSARARRPTRTPAASESTSSRANGWPRAAPRRAPPSLRSR